MTFQAVDALEGQKDGKGFQVGIPEMVATVREISDAEYNKKGKHIQQVVLQDSQGMQKKVKIYLGNGPVIEPKDVGTLQTFQQVAPNRYQNNMYYMAFWDNMHPPQGQPQQPATQLTPATQAIIDEARNRSPQQAAGQIQDHMGGQQLPTGPAGPEPPARRVPQPTQQDYEVKERMKVLGMCFTNLLSGRLAAVCPTEMEKDLGAIAALWRLSAICIDGTGQVEEIRPQALPDPEF